MFLSEGRHFLDSAHVTQPKLGLPDFTDIAQILLFMGLKTKGGTELPYICDKYSFCSLIGFLYGTTQGINYSQMLIYTLRVFLHSLHSRSWGKVVQEHTNLMCSIVPGTDRIFPWSFFTTLGALGEDSLWGLCPLRKIPNIFPFHFSSQEA